LPTLLNRVVVHYLDGRIVKGVCQDFYPNRERFHVAPPGKGPALSVDCRDLKAVFFVHDYDGNKNRQDLRGFLGGPDETRHGGKVAVLFQDRELICGYSLGQRKDRNGFFLFPADQESNNARIYVFTHAAVEIKFGSEADDLAQRVLSSRAA
jgi:hypothetical protein